MTHCLSEINKRHKAIDKMKESSQITPLNDTSWKVDSSVTRVMVDSCSCYLRCRTCGVCVHIFMCTCMDFILHATVCKHIHFVKVYLDSLLNEVSSINTTNNVNTSNAVSQHTFAAEEGESSVLVETTSVHEDEISDVLVRKQLNPALQLQKMIIQIYHLYNIYGNVFKQSQQLPLLGIEQYHYVKRSRLYYLIAQIWMPL